MKYSAFILAAVLAIGSAPAFAQANPGNSGGQGGMAFPAPVPQGNISTTSPTTATTPRDTGSMAYPAPLPQGNVSTTRPGTAPADTGSMAYPAPRPQGNVPAAK